MKEYLAKDIVALPAGRVRLDAAQEKARAHNLKALGDGQHEILNAIQFKRGERFCWDGEVPKALAGAFGEAVLVSVEPAPAAATTAAAPPKRKSIFRK